MLSRSARRACAFALPAAGLVCRAALASHGGPLTEAPQSVVIEGHYDNAVGTTDAASAGTVRRELLDSRPAQRPGEVLEFVPGVIVTQHSGDGKANQYFLRGFNLDHGTDFATRVAGMPVNLPTHGHGHGYSDLNFMLPELVDRVTYRKGPYFAFAGDFAAAGSAEVRYLTRLDAPLLQATVGPHGYRRGVAAGSAELQPGVHALAALEGMRHDGPWRVPQDLDKRNAVFSLAGGTRADGWQLAAMSYRARWTATDQIPQRLIDAGSFDGRPFGRFDSLDPTAGGRTSRHSLSGQWQREHAAGRSSGGVYAIRYGLDLNSNFTYALERPDDGDQFKQRDARSVYGLDLDHVLDHELGAWPARTAFGVQLRHDRIRVGLYDSVARTVTAVVREDSVQQTQTAAWVQTTIEPDPALRVVAGLRADHLRARVQALSLPANGGRASDTQVSPKLSLIVLLAPRTELFANAGVGLHSNDARGMTSRTDPRSGEPLDPVPPLVRLRGAELGLRTQALPGLQSSVALWTLRSDSELVYVGDAGSNEASAGSRRHGIEVNNRWQALPQLLIDADLALNRPRFADGSRIPNAVDSVGALAATWRDPAGWLASLQWRYLGSAALTEDGSVRSRPSSTFNLRLAHAITRKATLTLDVFNLFDRKVDDIQYVYESQLPGEAVPVEDRHVHPAEPRSLRLTLQARF